MQLVKVLKHLLLVKSHRNLKHELCSVVDVTSVQYEMFHCNVRKFSS